MAFKSDKQRKAVMAKANEKYKKQKKGKYKTAAKHMALGAGAALVGAYAGSKFKRMGAGIGAAAGYAGFMELTKKKKAKRRTNK